MEDKPGGHEQCAGYTKVRSAVLHKSEGSLTRISDIDYEEGGR